MADRRGGVRGGSRGGARGGNDRAGSSSRGGYSDRGGRSGGGGGGGSRGNHHRGGAGHGSSAAAAPAAEEKKRENILDLSKYMDKGIKVKFSGGREVVGILKGYDQLMNLVLDEVKEMTRDDEGNTSSRHLGLLVARGTLLVVISPVDGSEEIANPFLGPEDAEEQAVLPTA